MKLGITIAVDGGAFFDRRSAFCDGNGGGTETARILRALADAVERNTIVLAPCPGNTGDTRDANGNKVGYWVVTE